MGHFSQLRFTNLTRDRPAHSWRPPPIRRFELILAEPPVEYRLEKCKMAGVWNQLQTQRSPLLGFEIGLYYALDYALDAEALSAELLGKSSMNFRSRVTLGLRLPKV
jgi:hypothetical protein